MDETVVELLEHNADHAGAFNSRFDDVQNAQHPDVVTVCCSDSRVLQDEMWGNNIPGNIFTCGNIGNRVVQRTDAGEVVSGDVLYPIAHTGTETAVVVGHTGCGAVTATYQDITEGIEDAPGIEHCIATLRPHLEGGVEELPAELTDAESVNHLVEYNVDRQVELLRASDEIPETVTVVGVVYDFQDVYGGQRGEIQVINVDGERDVETLREAHPEVAERVNRRWAY
jgi:carbonic anhydrase